MTLTFELLFILCFISFGLCKVRLLLSLSQVIVLLFVSRGESAPALARLLQECSLLEALQLCLQLRTYLSHKEGEACLGFLRPRRLLKCWCLLQLLIFTCQLELLLLNFLEVQVIFRHLIKFRPWPAFSSNYLIKFEFANMCKHILNAQVQIRA
mgnify:CR=1 FL=1